STLVVVVEMSKASWLVSSPGIQATPAQGARASGRPADSGGHGPAGKHHRGVPARHGTAGIGPRADELDREDTCRAARAGTGYRAACDGAAARQGDRYRHRDGGYAGAGD